MSTQLSQVAPLDFSSQRVLRQPTQNKQLSLQEAYQAFNQPEAEAKPFRVWLLESSRSPIGLPGSTLRFNRDCFHILLNRSTALEDEAYVLGFMMGTAPQMGPMRLRIYKFLAQWLYPESYQFSSETLQAFSAGFDRGREPIFRNLYRLDFQGSQHLTIEYWQRHLELEETSH